MLLAEVVAASAAVSETSGRLEKISRLADLLRRLDRDDIPIVIDFLSGTTRQGRLGVGGSIIRQAHDVAPATEETLTIRDVDATFDDTARMAGSGSTRARVTRLRDLFSRATAKEQDFLARLLFGELRQGALEGVLSEAVAKASAIPAAQIRRAAMLAGELAPVAAAALVDGISGLAPFTLRPFRPVQPMLADSADGVEAALAELGEASFEHKLDGARIQVHRQDDDVRVYSRTLRDVTSAVPEVVDVVRALPARSLVLDGEVIALRDDGTPHPFQVTMSRFGRRLQADSLKKALPLTPMFFDVLYAGESVIDQPLERRGRILDTIVPVSFVVPRLKTADPAAAAAFAASAIAQGHEGVMAKGLAAPYAAGRRGQAWLKIKQARTLDLVVLAAEWGSGRRKGLLSNLHLGARDADRGGFVMLGKTFKGLTDAMLAWQTTKFLELEIARDAYTVYVRPEQVVEIAFNEIQVSPVYPGGLALRFARVKRYRDDKPASEADTLGAIQAIYRQQTGLEPPVRR